MTRVNKGKRKKAGKPKLVCTRAKGGKGCQYHSVPLEPVEQAVLEKAEWLVDRIPAGDKGGDLDGEAEQLRGEIDGLGLHLRDLMDAVKVTGPSRAAAERIAQLGAEIDTATAQLDAVEEQRRCVDGGLIRARAYSLAEAIRSFDGNDRRPLNAALRLLFDGVTVDYRTGRLIFHWRQGGETEVHYSYSFQPVTGGWEAPATLLNEDVSQEH
jgi:hypothetical protein